MSLALVRNAEVSYVFVDFSDRESGALFHVECAVHHVGDTITWPGVMFTADWRAILRHCHVDTYSPLAERWYMLAARWAFLRSRVAHAPGCSALKCESVYGLKDATFVCERCHRRCGYCFGANDDHPNFCDDCAGAEAEPFQLSRIIRRTPRARSIALREALYLGAGEEWVQNETLGVELRRANAAVGR